MLYNWNRDYIKSSAIKRTLLHGFGGISGVEQLIYHYIRFTGYEWGGKGSSEFLVRPDKAYK